MNENFKPMTDFLRHLTVHIPLPSACAQIYHRGQLVYSHAEGRPEGVEITPDTTYHLYSVSKVITCTAALQLLEQGKFMLSDPLYDYFPAFRRMFVCVEEGEDFGDRIAQGEKIVYGEKEVAVVPAKNPIRIRDLFTMSAGFHYNCNSPAIRHILAENDGAFPTLAIADALASEPLLYEPGTRWQYSIAHDVLGAFVEKVSGMPFGEYLRKNIFEPLGMSSFRFGRHGEAGGEEMAPKYMYSDEQKKPILEKKENPMLIGRGYESGGAGLIGSVADYAKFACAMSLHGRATNGARILAPATVDLMRTDFLTAEMRPYFNWSQVRGYGYGLGVRTHVDPTESSGLSPRGEFGWGGAAGAYVMIDPDKEVALFYGQHMCNNWEPYIHPRLRNLTYGCLGI